MRPAPRVPSLVDAALAVGRLGTMLGCRHAALAAHLLFLLLVLRHFESSLWSVERLYTPLLGSPKPPYLPVLPGEKGLWRAW
jgi:hypothetical protein